MSVRAEEIKQTAYFFWQNVVSCAILADVALSPEVKSRIPDQGLRGCGSVFRHGPDGRDLVTNTDDSGPGSLRQAILDANANSGADDIAFLIPGGGVHTINLASALPTIYHVTIDGYTQPGAKPNLLASGTDAVLLIEVNGANLPSGTATFQFGFGDVGQSGGGVLRGLVINGDVSILTGSNRVIGCYIGTNAAGSAQAGTRGAISISGTS